MLTNPAFQLVYVVEDDPSARVAVSRLLSTVYTVRAFASALDFMSEAEPVGSGCVVLDLKFPKISGLEVVESFTRRGSTLSFILVTGYGNVDTSVRAMKLGAVDFLSKPLEEVVLLKSVETALAISSDRYKSHLGLAEMNARFSTLTPRERAVCALVATGMPNKEIAFELGRSEKTVKVHRGRVMSKLSVRSVVELVRFVDRLGTAAPTES
jgi:FixJ family two-component response regulator